MDEKIRRIVMQQMRMIRGKKDEREARACYYETAGMLRGFRHCEAIDSMQLLVLTELAGNAYINAGRPW